MTMRSSIYIRSALGFVAALILLSGMADSGTLFVRGIGKTRSDFIVGADVSSLAQVEEKGGRFYDGSGKPTDALALLKAKGVNWLRFRLWNDPINHQPVVAGGKIVSDKGARAGGGNNDLARTVALVLRAKKLGFKVLLDFHYSDFWADPGKQAKPDAWKALHGAGLSKALADFTSMALRRIEEAGGSVDMVQLGNETNNGFLWPDGKLWKGAGDGEVGGFPGFIALLEAASKAVRSFDPAIKIAVHLADGASNGLYRAVFDPLVAAGLDFDVIGLSYYSYWHGSPADLRANLADLAARYGKDLVIMETAYAHTLADGDDQGNSFQVYNGPDGGWLPTVQGQASALREAFAAVAGAPGGKGLGAFYWEPAWIPVPGAGWRTGEGDSWENQALFDYAGKALPSLDVFRLMRTEDPDRTPRPVRVEDLSVEVSLPAAPLAPPRVKTIMEDDSWTWQEASWELPDASVWAGMKDGSTYVLKGNLRGGGIPAKLTFTFTGKHNLIEDPSWESGKLGAWTVVDPQGASKVENNQGNALSGSWTFKYWSDKAFTIELSRTFTGLAPGDYVFSLSSMGGGGENSIAMFARDAAGGAELTAPIAHTGWKKWKTWTIPAIRTGSGSVTIGIRIDAKSGNWGNFDDFEFYRDFGK